MNDQPRRMLSALIAHHGRSLADDPHRLESLLRDRCPGRRGEVNVLIAARRHRVPQDLAAAGATSLPTLLPRLTRRLEEDAGLASEAARWAVESWALAIGAMTTEELQPALSARPRTHAPSTRQAVSAPGSPSVAPTSSVVGAAQRRPMPTTAQTAPSPPPLPPLKHNPLRGAVQVALHLLGGLLSLVAFVIVALVIIGVGQNCGGDRVWTPAERPHPVAERV